jgi:hypothetical protein
MIVESNKFGLKSILILLDDKQVENVLASKKYQHIIFTSYHRWDLPAFALREKTTALIPLTLPEADIFARFNDTTRNEIRKSQRQTELTVVSAAAITSDSYDLYQKFEYSQHRVPSARQKLSDCLFFGAYYQDQLISGIYLMDCRPYLRIRSIFSLRLQQDDPELYKIISNASRRLIWEICLWGKQQGFQSLDLASVNFHNPKTANITKFKMSFGGEVVSEYTYSYSSPLYRLFERLVKLKKLALVFKKLWK